MIKALLNVKENLHLTFLRKEGTYRKIRVAERDALLRFGLNTCSRRGGTDLLSVRANLEKNRYI